MVSAYNEEKTYIPQKDPVYMSTQMKRYFQELLCKELQQLLANDSAYVLESEIREPDFVDQSTNEELRFNHHAYREHEQHLHHEIESALQRLIDGCYGYCLVTGQPIGVARLLAAPYAKYRLDVQEEKETMLKKNGMTISSGIESNYSF